MAMKMAVVSMEMTPGAIPRPGGVPEQSLLSPGTEFRNGGGVPGVFLEFRQFVSGFLGHEGLYRRRGGVGGARGLPPHRLAPPLGRAALWSGGPGPPLRLPFGVLVRLGEIRCLAFVSSNSENIARTAFLEPKTTENRNWHCGILLIG